MWIKTCIYILNEGTGNFIAQSKIQEKKPHTQALYVSSCQSEEKSRVGGKKRQDLALRILFDNSYVLVSEQESQIVEALESMGTESAQQTRLNAPTYSAPAGPSRASLWSGPAGPLEAAQSLSKGESVRGAGQTAKVRAYVTACARACVAGRGSKEPPAQSEAASYREKETSPASPSLPPSRHPVHSLSRPPAGPAGCPRQRCPLTFEIVL